MAMVVPFGRSPAAKAQAQLPMPDPQWAMMAAAMMHENGRLVQSEDKVVGYDTHGIGDSEFGQDVLKNARKSQNIEDERGPNPDALMEHNKKLPLLEVKPKQAGPTS